MALSDLLWEDMVAGPETQRVKSSLYLGIFL